MGSIRVVIHPAKERGRRVFPDKKREIVAASRMVIEERRNVVDESGYQN